MFPINNSTFTSQYPMNTHTTSAILNYDLPTSTVTYFQLTTLHLHLSIPWPHTPHLPYQIVTSQLPLLHISNQKFHIYISISPDQTHQICHVKLWLPNSHSYIFPNNNFTFTSQYPLTTHNTSALWNYNLPTPTVTYF